MKSSNAKSGDVKVAKTSGLSGRAAELLRYALIRILLIIPTALILVTLVFFLMRLVGDPITAALGGRLSADKLAQMKHAAGYDRPVIVQYFEYLGQLVRGDFGVTFSDNRPVLDIFRQNGTATLELGIFAIIIAALIGVPLGIVAAVHKDHWQDIVLRVFSAISYATPIFFLGLVFKLVFGSWMGMLPISGRASSDTALTLTSAQGATGLYLLDAISLGSAPMTLDVLRHAVLPAVSLGLITGGVFIRLVRSQMVSTLASDYTLAGRARGIREKTIHKRFALRPALGPILTVAGLQIAMILGGAVLTETTFDWHGLGYELAQYLSNHDFTAVQGIVVLMAIIVSVVNCVIDILVAINDPRIRS
ncbi:ABC transporter permease [Bifidobacterium olomucense]|uniref:Peptide ABC transporter permease n=1 Tax=Bifidobacterium olomucense TaxID=2675324 RepID=A0A7Y0EXT5_9BIFI|nr:ABC transporter permease [Bifidobacterium sp. DSM 109959]NMM98392.1 peptide ABC transporter permease [Bifidobacterium sp. DSM 109959]